MTKKEAFPTDPKRPLAPCAGPNCEELVTPKQPHHTPTEPRNGRLRRYCSQRCRQRAYRTRHTPTRQTLQKTITDGLQELRSLPRLTPQDLHETSEKDLTTLAQYVGRARAIHEKILDTLGTAEKQTQPQESTTTVYPPPMPGGARHQELPFPTDS